jgi:hypothetical protein
MVIAAIGSPGDRPLILGFAGLIFSMGVGWYLVWIRSAR